MFQDKAMLVDLSISQWGNRKLDKQVGREVDTQHQAQDAGRYNKILLDKLYLADITKVVSQLKDSHMTATLPWGNNGQRLLPSALFMEYSGKIRSLKSDFETAVNDFVRKYPAAVVAAEKRLGSLYDAGDYPDSGDIVNKFDIELNFAPVPTANDFRVDIGKEEARMVRARITEYAETQQRAAMKECWSRLRTTVEKIHERLSNEDAVFRDSLIENARSLVDLLPKLNISEDAELETMRRDVEKHLCAYAPQRLRDDKELRAQTAQAAQDLLGKMFGSTPVPVEEAETV